MPAEIPRSSTAKVVVATTVALSFISFWRAAAIVLSDLASSAFYAGGIAEHAVGKSAPWFILGVMLFSFAVRSVYLESCSMFVRGGVYIVVRDAMGHFMARLSVSALIKSPTATAAALQTAIANQLVRASVANTASLNAFLASSTQSAMSLTPSPCLWTWVAMSLSGRSAVVRTILTLSCSRT